MLNLANHQMCYSWLPLTPSTCQNQSREPMLVRYKNPHTFATSSAREAISVDGALPSRHVKQKRHGLKIHRKGVFLFRVASEPTRYKIFPFNGPHHPRLEESRKKNRSGNPLSGRGIGERRARGVHSLRSHWSVGGAYELDADKSESPFERHTESPLARAFSLQDV